MANKYGKLKEKLTKHKEAPEYQERVDKEKAKLAKKKTVTIAKRFNADYLAKKELQEEIKKLNLSLEASTQLIVERFEEDDVTSMKLTDGTHVFLNDKPYCSVVDQDKLFAWIKKGKRTELLGVKTSTLNSMVRDNLLDGKTLPPGIDVFMKTDLSRRGPTAPSGKKTKNKKRRK